MTHSEQDTSTQSVQAIEAQIEQTRAAIASDIRELEEKLHPSQLVTSTKNFLEPRVVPLALLASGIGLWIVSGSLASKARARSGWNVRGGVERAGWARPAAFAAGFGCAVSLLR